MANTATYPTPTWHSSAEQRPVPEHLSEPAVPAGARFGIPHALVIICFVAAATVLAALGMTVQETILLLSGAGGAGAAVVLITGYGKRGSGGVLRRVLRAALTQGR